MYKLACRSAFVLSLLALGLVVQPALAQNRFMEEAKEKAARRAENAAIRAAEHPEITRTAAVKEPGAPKPAESQPSPSPSTTQGAAPTRAQASATPAQYGFDN
jgi:hypothetical protein